MTGLSEVKHIPWGIKDIRLYPRTGYIYVIIYSVLYITYYIYYVLDPLEVFKLITRNLINYTLNGHVSNSRFTN